MGSQPFLYNIPESAYDSNTGAGSYQVSRPASGVVVTESDVGMGWAWTRKDVDVGVG
jgi:hypothetical protein